jgi:hypothetical protein
LSSSTPIPGSGWDGSPDPGGDGRGTEAGPEAEAEPEPEAEPGAGEDFAGEEATDEEGMEMSDAVVAWEGRIVVEGLLVAAVVG